MDRSIDPNILPLVEALNGIDGVRTIASCEGHFRRISDPYVYFHCPLATAARIAAHLDKLNRDGRLCHWWTLVGCFNGEHKLCFRLQAPALNHGEGAIRTFLNYVPFRMKIDGDLSVLADELGAINPSPDCFPVLDTASAAYEHAISSFSVSDPARAKLRKPGSLAIATVLMLALAACAGDVELQKDGTGTDEMLRSPCACLPILYDPVFYRWVG